MRKTTTRGRWLKRLQVHVQPVRFNPAHASPVGRAVIAKEEVDCVTELMTRMTSVSVRIYLTADGERDT